jgi:hypothetical protein
MVQNPESIRYQVVRMMRLLVEITQTLERVPEERYILMKVEYTDDTPASFNTPSFCEASPDQMAAHFEQTPFCMCAPGYRPVLLNSLSMVFSS